MTTIKDISTLALCGLILGTMLGIIAAGAYATWAVRGDMTNIGFGTIFAFAPWEIGYFGEPFRTALMIGGVVAAILTVAVPVLGLRKELTSYGSARWAEPAELKRQGMTVQARVNPKKGGLIGPIFGKLGGPWSAKPFLTSQNHPHSADAIPHSLVDGPAGAGKGVGIIIPTLLTYWGSVIVFDPKGENFAKTARRRKAMGDAIYRFDPYAADRRTHRYNPLDYVAGAPRHERLKEAKRVAASLITRSGKEENFLGGARDIFAATSILMVHRKTATISAVYDALTQAGGAFKALATMAEEADAAGIPEAAGLLRQYAGYEAKVLSSYMSVLFEGGLSLWADPTVRAATSATDFRIETMRQRATSVYVTVSPNDLEPLAPLVRVLFQQAIGVISQREPVKRRKPGLWGRLRGQRKAQAGELHEPFPVLFLIDEFASLGKMEVLIRALTWLRGYGGRVMIVIQSLASIRNIYGKDGADELLGLCGFQVFMSPSDKETPEYISQSVGKFTRKSRSKQWTSNEFKSRYHEQEEGSELIRPEQVRMIGNRKIIALVENSRPVLTNRVTYFEDHVLKRIFNGQKGEHPMPRVPLQLGPTPTPSPNYKFYDVDPHQTAPTADADKNDAIEPSPVQTEPIEVPVPTTPEASQPFPASEPKDNVAAANGHSVDVGRAEEASESMKGHRSGITDQPAEELPAEAEEAVHRGLTRIVGGQVALETYLDDRLANAQTNNRQKTTASLRRPKSAAPTDNPPTPAQTPNPKDDSAGAGLDDILRAVQRENLDRIEAQKKGVGGEPEGYLV